MMVVTRSDLTLLAAALGTPWRWGPSTAFPAAGRRGRHVDAAAEAEASH